jgi:hypothetical protein
MYLKTVTDKTHMEGHGPKEAFENYIPCMCLLILSGGQKISFGKSLQNDPHCPCVSVCAYDIV